MKRQNARDRRHEREGMERYEDRKMEKRNGEMREDRRDFANMPQNPIMREYPKNGYSGDVHLDDTIVRLDDDAEDSARKIRGNRPHCMY